MNIHMLCINDYIKKLSEKELELGSELQWRFMQKMHSLL